MEIFVGVEKHQYVQSFCASFCLQVHKPRCVYQFTLVVRHVRSRVQSCEACSATYTLVRYVTKGKPRRQYSKAQVDSTRPQRTQVLWLSRMAHGSEARGKGWRRVSQHWVQTNCSSCKPQQWGCLAWAQPCGGMAASCFLVFRYLVGFFFLLFGGFNKGKNLISGKREENLAVERRYSVGRQNLLQLVNGRHQPNAVLLVVAQIHAVLLLDL